MFRSNLISNESMYDTGVDLSRILGQIQMLGGKAVIIDESIVVSKQMGRAPGPGVTGQNIPPAGIYPGLKWPRLDYTRACYGLGQFIPRGILWPRPIHTSSGQNIPS